VRDLATIVAVVVVVAELSTEVEVALFLRHPAKWTLLDHCNPSNIAKRQNFR